MPSSSASGRTTTRRYDEVEAVETVRTVRRAARHYPGVQAKATPAVPNAGSDVQDVLQPREREQNSSMIQISCQIAVLSKHLR